DRPETRKERRQPDRAGLGENAVLDVEAMVQARVRAEGKQGPQRSGLRVIATEDHLCYASLEQSAGAHRARLERYVDRRALEPPALDALARLSEREDLGVCGRVSKRFSL